MYVFNDFLDSCYHLFGYYIAGLILLYTINVIVKRYPKHEETQRLVMIFFFSLMIVGLAGLMGPFVL